MKQKDLAGYYAGKVPLAGSPPMALSRFPSLSASEKPSLLVHRMFPEYTAAVEKTQGLNAFRSHADSLIAHGFCPLPIGAGTKAPGEYAGRLQDHHFFPTEKYPIPLARELYPAGDATPFVTPYSRPLKEWQLFTAERLRPGGNLHASYESWQRMPASGIGAMCGELIGIDVDIDDPVLLEAVEFWSADLDSEGVRVAKRGQRGYTIFFRQDGSIASGKIGPIDILAAGRQSVLPPSRHPNTGQSYIWTSERSLFDTPLDALPMITAQDIADLAQSLGRAGIEVKKVEDGYSGNTQEVDARQEHQEQRSADLNKRVNQLALDNLAAWVPELPIARLRPYRGGWNGVAHWRPSGTGRPVEIRKLNLYISSSRGITDFGAGGRGYSPITLVMACMGMDSRAAWKWLWQRVDTPLPPWNPIVSQAVRPVEPVVEGRELTVSQAGAAIDEFVRAFRDRAIPAQREREMLLQRALVRVELAFDREADCELRYKQLAEADRAWHSDSVRIDEAAEQGIVLHRSTRETFRMAVAVGDWYHARDIRESIENEIRDLAGEYELWVADPYCGTGKTRSIGQNLLSSRNLNIIHASPTNRLSWDVQARYFSQGVRVLAGWSGTDADGNNLCKRCAQGERLHALGVAWTSMCLARAPDGSVNKCRYFDECPARDMMARLHDAQHVAVTHNHLQRAKREEIAFDPDAISIDESISAKIFGAHAELKIADINLDFCDEQNSDRTSADEALAHLRSVLLSAADGAGIAFAEAHKIDKRGLAKAKYLLQAEIGKRGDEDLTDASDEDIAMLEARNAQFPTARLRRMQTLIDEVKKIRHDDEGQMGRVIREGDAVHVAAIRELNSGFVGGLPILHASAFPEPDGVLRATFSYTRMFSAQNGWRMYADVAPVMSRMAPMRVRQGDNVMITQYRNAGATVRGLGLSITPQVTSQEQLMAVAGASEWKDKTIQERTRELDRRLSLAAFIRRECDTKGKVVLIASQRFRNWLSLWFADHGGMPADLDLLEWGRAMGQNAYEGHHSLIVVGGWVVPRRAGHLRFCSISGQWQPYPEENEEALKDAYSVWAEQNSMGQAIERIRTRHDKSVPVTVHVFHDGELPMDAVEDQAGRVFNEMSMQTETEGPTQVPLSKDRGLLGGLVSGKKPCLALSVRAIMDFEGASNLTARKLTKDRAVSGTRDGYIVVAAKFRDASGGLVAGPYAEFAVLAGLDPWEVIEAFTGRQVGKIRH